MKFGGRLSIGFLTTVAWLAAQPVFAVEGYPTDAPGEERPAGMFEVSEDVVTPHTAWAKPYAQPAPAILFIVPRWSAREVVELAQRMPMRYAVVMTGSQTKLADVTDDIPRLWPSAERPAQTAKRLSDALGQRWDTIVVGNALLSSLPTNVVEAIVSHVRAGGALFIAGNANTAAFTNLIATATSETVPPALAATMPLRLFPAFTDAAALPPYAAWRLGKGLVVSAQYALNDGNMAVSPHLTIAERMRQPAAYDYYQSLVVKALLWTAGRWPGADSLVTVEAQPSQVAIRAHIGAEARSVRLRLRDAADRQREPTLQPAQTNTVIAIPSDLPVGQHFADVWLLDRKQRVLDWMTVPFTVTDAQGIALLTNAEASVALGAPVKASLTLRQPLAANEGVVMELRDFHQRLLGRTHLKTAGQTDFTADLPTAGCLSLVVTVVARVERAGKTVDEQHVTVPVLGPTGQGPGWDDFSLMVWNFYDSAPVDFVFHQLREAGMDRLMTGAWAQPEEHLRQAKLVAERYDCRAFPYAYWINSVVGQFGCDPEPVRSHLGAVARGLAPYGCDTFSMGDESKFGPTDEPLTDPWVNGSFRAYVQKQYASLDVLNVEWNTTFTNWNDVNGITLQDATNRHQEARWVDHRLHRETLFADAFATGQDAVRKANPLARCGFEGIFQTDSFRGYDWSKLCAAATLFGNYWFNPAEWDIIGSLKQPDTYWGFWNGAYMDVSNRRSQGWIAWRCLFWGMNSCWYWVPYWPVSYDCAFGTHLPDLRENPVFTPFLKAVGELKRGPGKLLLNAQRVYAPVAIHYSQASVHANTLDDAGFTIVGAGIPAAIHHAWLTAAWSLKEAGLQPRFVAYDAIERSALKDYRVLFLPFSQAISTQEVAQMRAFVEAGGVLVADVRPGLRDGHGKLQSKGLLDDLFGVEWKMTERPSLLSPTNLVLDLTLAGRRIQGTLPLAQPDPAVRVTTGTALAQHGKVPLFVEHRVGKGRTLLLNYAGTYAPATFDTIIAPEIRTKPAGDLYRDIALACAALGGVQPEIAATTDGHPLRGIDMVAWKDGAAAYYGFTPNDYCDYAWTITMPKLTIQASTTEPGCFYDVRNGRFLGEGRTFSAPFTDDLALLIARLPYRVKAVSVEGPKRATQGQPAIFSIRVVPRKGTAGTHVVHVEVCANGKTLPHYAANVKAANGMATYTVPLALDDPQGTWSVTVRDVATGTSGRRSFAVE